MLQLGLIENMQTKNAVDLCGLLVGEVFGEFTSRTYTQLLYRGRQSIHSLCRGTRLSGPQVRRGLVVLIQQNLAYYHFDHDSRTTYYEANRDSAHFLIRTGKGLDIIQSRYGVVAKDIFQNLLLLGHTKISDLKATVELENHAKDALEVVDHHGDAVPNGVSKNHPQQKESSTSEDFNMVLTQLLEAGFVEPVLKTMFRSPSDTYNDLEQEAQQDLKNDPGSSVQGPKYKAALRDTVHEKLRELRDERGWKGNTTLKRQSNGIHVNGVKRRKLINGDLRINGDAHDDHDESYRLDSDMVIRVNHEKCTVALRTQQMVALVRRDIGETTSYVYAEILRLLEEKISRCHLHPVIDNDFEEPFISTLELNFALSKSIDLSRGIGKPKLDESETPAIYDTGLLEQTQKKRKRVDDDIEAGVEGYASSDEAEQDYDDVDEYGNIMGIDEDSDSQGEAAFIESHAERPRPTKVTFHELPKPKTSDNSQSRALQLKQHLLLLVEHSHRLLRRCGGGGGGEYTVDFDQVIEYMKETALDTYIFQTFGPHGLRIARILKRNGKLDEKQIQKFGLLKQKDVRTKLVEMQMTGCVDIQEVPRDSNRTSARTIYLWYFDVDRVNTLALDMTLKTMVRCLQTVEVERFREKNVLAEAERTDVKGKEEDVLKAEPLQRLRVFRAKEDKLLTQVSRLDHIVGVLRDF